jgi:CheY-like chemotaxis protein
MSDCSAESRRVLVVEDAEAIRKMVCSMLHQSGYECLEAENGTQALQLMERHCGEIHLVLTDMIMPHMNGTELASHLSRLRPELPIIFMSGYTEDPVVRDVEQAGSVFLAKPFTAHTLLEKVGRVLNSRRNGCEHDSGPGR